MLAFAPATIVHQRYQIVRLVGRGGMGLSMKPSTCA